MVWNVCFIAEAATAATKKLLDELKTEAESISELNVWKDIENMRVAYQYEKEEYFLCENIGLYWYWLRVGERYFNLKKKDR